MSARILIVDDDPSLTQAFRLVLEDRLADTIVDVTTSSTEAIELVRATDYEAVLADIRMPDLDGLELLRRVREIRPDTPTLLMTGHGEHRVAVEALRCGAADFLEKPIDLDYLVAALTRAVRLREMSRSLEERRVALERHAADLAHIVEEQTKELRDANRVKDEFLAMLSHELRTPLTAILGWARLMLRDKLEPKLMAEAVASIERNASLQARLIEDLLDVSRVISGKLRLSLRPIDLAGVVAAASAALQGQARGKDIQLESVRRGDPAQVQGDPDRLQQVVTNILSNAIKFTPDGGKVTIEQTSVGGHAILRVRDTGIGIPADFMPHVFDWFRQADSSLAGSRRGLGLGLALARHLVELHGGTIEAESAGPGQGSVFTVDLPQLLGVRRESGSAAHLRPAGDGTRLDGLRVLLVEDEADTRAVIRASLERFGATVIAVESGAAATPVLDGDSLPDVLLCDIGMPREDGYALIRRLRARTAAKGGGIPAAALTAYARVEDARHALSQGFDLHLAKPIEPVELAMAVAELARGARTPSQCGPSSPA